MILFSIIFEVTHSSADNCYTVGDKIIADDIKLIPPDGKGLCTLLIPRLLDIIEKEELQNFRTDDSEFTFSCKGDKKACNGVLQLKVSDSQLGDESFKKNSDEILKLISKIAFFKTFSASELRSIYPLLSYTKSESGTILIEQGSQPKNTYIILSGTVDIFDGEKKITTLGPGKIFGEMSLLGKKKAVATVKVNKTSWIIKIKREDFQKILLKFPKAQMFLVKLLSRRLSQTSNVRKDEFATAMSGQLTHLPPADLLQMLNSSQKTGSLALDLNNGEAIITFWKGELLGAKYGMFTNEEAFFEILRENSGQFRFTPGDETTDRKDEIMANFMGLLLEGLQRLDEERSN